MLMYFCTYLQLGYETTKKYIALIAIYNFAFLEELDWTKAKIFPNSIVYTCYDLGLCPYKNNCVNIFLLGGFNTAPEVYVPTLSPTQIITSSS